jgi:thiol-disulfide isomerase/thioredoxin
MNFNHLFLLFISILILSCKTQHSKISNPQTLKNGIWRAELSLTEEQKLPFNFETLKDGSMIFYNDAENIIVKNESIVLTKDSLKFYFPVFSTFVEAKIYRDSLVGFWVNPEKKDYKIPFKAIHGQSERFLYSNKIGKFNVEGNWEVTFSPNTSGSYKAKGIFKQKENKVSGTFLTETGDYRYLEGILDENQLKLSAFDGAHAFLFSAEVLDDSIIYGMFYSGKHWKEPWTATRNENFNLADPEKLTYLNQGFDKFNFSFPDENSDTISLNDSRFQNKVIIVQIMGSWCPNCMDESRFLVEMYQKYKNRGLEIIAIDFEIRNDFEVFKRNISKMKKDLNIDYPIVFGGSSKKSESSKTLPMLNQILSYPTTIFIDRNGDIKKIETGFSGPGTGTIYDEYKRKTIDLIESLLKN